MREEWHDAAAPVNFNPLLECELLVVSCIRLILIPSTCLHHFHCHECIHLDTIVSLIMFPSTICFTS